MLEKTIGGFMKKYWMSLMTLSLAAVFCSVNGYADDEQEQKPTADECSQEVLLSFFPEVFVKGALEKHHVPKDKWDAILSALKAKDQSLIKDVQAKAEAMNPNPMKNPNDPEQRTAAIKLFRDTMQDGFSSVLKANGVTDDEEILGMLDEVQEARAKRFESCVKAGYAPKPPGQQQK